MKKSLKKERYRPTESKYKGGAHEMYVTYDLEQKTRSGRSVIYPKVKRVYIAGNVKDWKKGTVKKRSGREVSGMLIEYEQTRKHYRRKGYTAEWGGVGYKVSPASVGATSARFTQVVEVPEAARNIHFHTNVSKLPAKYRQALQNIR